MPLTNKSVSSTTNSKIETDNTLDKMMKKENEELKDIIQHLETELDTALQEREFYFGKLRSIEVLIQTIVEEIPEKKSDALIMDIEAILYSTEVFLIIFISLGWF